MPQCFGMASISPPGNVHIRSHQITGFCFNPQLFKQLLVTVLDRNRFYSNNFIIFINHLLNRIRNFMLRKYNQSISERTQQLMQAQAFAASVKTQKRQALSWLGCVGRKVVIRQVIGQIKAIPDTNSGNPFKQPRLQGRFLISPFQ